ncbi:MAG: DUF2171 domain-containing protein [Pirellulales bacterium]
MNNTSEIREHMEVVACCGTHVGEVDRVEGKTIKLTKNDPAANGHHHYIPVEWIDKVDQCVRLAKNSDEVFQTWSTEPASV